MLVKTKYGELDGIDTQDAYVYLGVPYAAPPVGELRWKAPESVDFWEGVKKADHFSPRCPQLSMPEGTFYHKEFYSDPRFMPDASEDCLYLNIWVPRHVDGKAPVAVWFHGGAFSIGFNSEMEFDGNAYARRGIILVTVNYRLGLLGFFAHPALTERDGHSGNYGLLDQIAAIDWVRGNIEAFGGDPGNITIFGQSAGGMSVRCLLASPLAAGKVQRAIIQSGGGYQSVFPAGRSGKKLEKAGEEFLESLHLSLDGFYEKTADELAFLTAVFNKNCAATADSILPLAPVADGYVLEGNFEEAVDADKIPPVSLMVGCNTNDLGNQVDFLEHPEKNDLYASNLRLGDIFTARGRDIFEYYFTRKMPGDEAGAFHSAELWYMFGTLDRCWRPLTESDHALSGRMLDAWAGFMRSGDPGWKRYADGGYVQRLTV